MKFLNYRGDVMKKNRFELSFGDDMLDDCAVKITDKYIFFVVNIINYEIRPMHTINELILNNTDLNIKISILNGVNQIVSFIYLENVNLLKVKNLLDFDYNDEDSIIKVKVKYKYKKQKTFKNINEIICYQRKQKIEKINQL